MFFCNSGAEANEAAIKIARKYHAAGGHPERFRIVTFAGAFHGRTLATLAAGGQQKYIEGFGPKVEGFDQVPAGDCAALEAVIGPETAALMIEPIQGEGGVREIPHADLRRLREICDAHGPAADHGRGPDRRRAAPASCSPMNGPASPRTS